ncbi:MAG: hypothetical protein LBV41_13345, partial [Cytophagaceae bacterium]|jgi:hypothetical protein|nr:hypothetical protein [Cytophagaceae bacterium]
MEAKVVLDMSSIVWDENHFQTDPALHYNLAREVILFIQAFESCRNLRLVARTELLNNALNLFPYNIAKNRRELFDFKRRTQMFLSNRLSNSVSYGIDSTVINSQPNICCSYFAPDLKTEIGYLITEMHNNSEKHIFYTFATRWQSNNNLKTINGGEKEHQTVIHKDSSSTIEKYYLNNVGNVFEHNPKHDSCKGKRKEGGEWIYPLSCYDERKKDTSAPQQLLDIARQYGGEYYSYDTHNCTFVCFKNHQDNKYHGYDEDLNNVPQKIREEFHK